MLPGFHEQACGFRGPQRGQEHRVQEPTLLAERHRTSAGGPSQPKITPQAPSDSTSGHQGPAPRGRSLPAGMSS